jgi:hypothetical protein
MVCMHASMPCHACVQHTWGLEQERWCFVMMLALHLWRAGHNTCMMGKGKFRYHHSHHSPACTS